MVCLSHLVVGFSSKQEIAIEHPSSDSELGDAEGCDSEGEAITGKSAIPLVKGMDPNIGGYRHPWKARSPLILIKIFNQRFLKQVV